MLRQRFRWLKQKTLRFNQVVLCFPLWMVLGISGFFRREEKSEGWQQSQKNTRYLKMY